MTKRLREDVVERLGLVGETLLINAQDKRQRVITHASRVIDVLKGVEAQLGVRPVNEDVAADYNSSPAEMPQMGWSGVIGTQGGIRGSLGEFYASRFNNQPPSETFNAGFYAGVLAAKEGLIEVEQFTHDSELHTSFDPSQLFIED